MHPLPPEQAEALLARIAGGDRAAFDALFRATADRLHALCLGVLRERPLAEQVLEQVFLTIWSEAGRQPGSRLSAMGWLVTLTRNLALARLRPGEDAPEALPPDAPGLTARNEGLAQLTPEQAEALRAAYLRGAATQPARDALQQALVENDGSDALAAAAAAGLLRGAEAGATRQRTATDPDFAAQVAGWRDALAQMANELTPVLAPSRSKVMIDRQLGHAAIPELQPEPHGPIALGRWLLIAALLAGLGLGAAALLPRLLHLPGLGGGYQAGLALPDEALQIGIRLDRDASHLTATLEAGTPQSTQDYRLWWLAPAASPVLIGRVPAQGSLRFVLPEGLVPAPDSRIGLTDGPATPPDFLTTAPLTAR